MSLPRPPPVPSEMVGSLQHEVVEPNSTIPKQFKLEPRDVPPTLASDESRPSMLPAELESLVAERSMRQAAEHNLEVGRNALAEALQRIEDAHKQMVNDLTARAADLATLLARRVIARELHTQRDIVVDLVREALDVLNSRDRIRVHLGSEFAVMQNALIAHYTAMSTLIDVVVDENLPPYGCMVETDVGSVDESIESRLAALLDSVPSDEEE
jgi:flagellar biosynthesis/type III secretory pathway protein FliH